MDHEHESEEDALSDTNTEEKLGFTPTQEEMNRYIGNL